MNETEVVRRARRCATLSELDQLLTEVQESETVEQALPLLEKIASACHDLSFQDRTLTAWYRLQNQSPDNLAELAISSTGCIAASSLRVLSTVSGQKQLDQLLVLVAARASDPSAVTEALNTLTSSDDRVSLLGQVVWLSAGPANMRDAAKRLAETDPVTAFHSLLKALDCRDRDPHAAAEIVAEFVPPGRTDEQLENDLTKIWQYMFACADSRDYWDAANRLSDLIRSLGDPAVRLTAVLNLMGDDEYYAAQNLDARYLKWSINAPSDKLVPVFQTLTNRVRQRPNDRHLRANVAFFMRLLAGNADTAGDIITQVAGSSADEWIRNLRIELGGEVAMAPILQELDRSFVTNLLEPVAGDLSTTRKEWLRTMSSGKRAFQARLWMSVIVFVVGLGLTAAGGWMIVTGGNPELWGPGITFAAGLAAMLSVVFVGPATQIREATEQLGIANMAFMTFLHRINLVVHTFVKDYRAEDVDLKKLSKLESMLQDAASSSVQVLLSTGTSTGSSLPDPATR